MSKHEFFQENTLNSMKTHIKYHSSHGLLGGWIDFFEIFTTLFVNSIKWPLLINQSFLKRLSQRDYHNKKTMITRLYEKQSFMAF